MAFNWDRVAAEDDFKNPTEFLRWMYWTRGMSLTDIGHNLGISHVTVYHKMLELDIEMRSKGGRNNVRYAHVKITPEEWQQFTAKTLMTMKKVPLRIVYELTKGYPRRGKEV